MSPQRVQMSRRQPWRAEHPDAVIVARPSRWGNPYMVGSHYMSPRFGDQVRSAADAVRDYRRWILRDGRVDAILARESLHLLRGRDLACWCPLDQPCHADVLLQIANGDLP